MGIARFDVALISHHEMHRPHEAVEIVKASKSGCSTVTSSHHTNVATSAAGTAIPGMMVAAMLRKNRNMTITQRHSEHQA